MQGIFLSWLLVLPCHGIIIQQILLKKMKIKKELTALEAKAEAQKIAFGPMLFQAVVALRKLGILKMVSRHKNGIGILEIAKELSLSEYGVSTLLELAASAGIVEYQGESKVNLSK